MFYEKSENYGSELFYCQWDDIYIYVRKRIIKHVLIERVKRNK